MIPSLRRPPPPPQPIFKVVLDPPSIVDNGLYWLFYNTPCMNPSQKKQLQRHTCKFWKKKVFPPRIGMGFCLTFTVTYDCFLVISPRAHTFRYSSRKHLQRPPPHFSPSWWRPLNPFGFVWMLQVKMFASSTGENHQIHLGVNPKIGVKTPKWMVKIMENPMNKWMIWGAHPYFWKHPFRCYINKYFKSPNEPYGLVGGYSSWY